MSTSIFRGGVLHVVSHFEDVGGFVDGLWPSRTAEGDVGKVIESMRQRRGIKTLGPLELQLGKVVCG